MTNGSILVVEDNAIVGKDIADSLISLGYAVPAIASTAQEALARARESHPHLALMDIRLKGEEDGIEAATSLRNELGIPVVYLTAHADNDTLDRAKATRPLGYLVKPFEDRQLYTTLEIALNQLRSEKDSFVQEQPETHSSNERFDGKELHEDEKPVVNNPKAFRHIVGSHPAMLRLFERVELVAQTDVSVHIYGENGTGKELIADVLHRLSDRSQKRFVKLNCSAIPATLLESALFGHVKGAFTGATKDQEGFVEHAEGGTIFLDEIGDIPHEIQIKLLRLLQNREFCRVGETRVRKANIRIITATNQNLKELVTEGKIREDFYYRINVFPLTVPPLRERLSDITSISTHFIRLFNKQFGRSITGLSRETVALFEVHPWRGNVRELENAIKHAFVILKEGEIEPGHLPPEVTARQSLSTLQAWSPFSNKGEAFHEPDEKELIVEALRKTGGNKTQAARLLGYSRVTLWKKIKKYDLKQG